jgi:hypothetical protein
VIRAKVEAITGPLNDDEFRQVLDLATTDIMVNRVAWGKRTRVGGVIEIAGITLTVLRRVAA